MTVGPPRLPSHAGPQTPATRLEDQIVEAAWLYYHEGLNQNEIAGRMGISRASVVNYLNEARARGWVRVYLDSDVFRQHRLAAELCAVFGLKEAIVVPDDPADPSATEARVIRAAADWLPRLLEPGDRLGVSWGETVYSLARAMAYQPMPGLTVMQLLGSRPADAGFAAETCTTTLALKLGAAYVNLHVPLLLSDKGLRDRLAAEPEVAAQLDALATCNKTVLACGTCTDDAHIVRTGLLTATEMARYRTAGAAGVICARLIDADGKEMPSAAEDRMIGVTLDRMRGKEMALLVAAGAGRTAPARAAIRGGFATHLATSAGLAADLLSMP